ncbi:MAG: sugar ABC transporter permease [Candidatus Treponema excrementipullorum]|nr:sugar ABC transporter permease [Spirochaetia bacterium]MDD7012490.1 sugar ABC transporter permease [Candidatus Treponema excrementipullorum]MCI6952935.1 sugar ABC transporter permease [Spirochaetia bacterium]MCI7588231.1 sugar ABC transporter permease [Spirochaetia bacterium]MDY2755301.1 sugar ABC transporter permease [Candidatus Treponema excrementipullorum]
MEKSLRKYFPLFALPGIICFLLAFLIPMIMGIYLSFCEFTNVTNAKWVGLDNYITAFTVDNYFSSALWLTIKFTIVSVITINFFAFGFALLLTRGITGTNVFRTIFFMPNLIGGIVLGWIWQVIINGILYTQGVTIVSDPKYGFWGLVVLMNWQNVGYMMVIYIAAIQNIPSDMLEAAAIDGANYPTILRKIIIPTVMPSITICLFMTVTNGFKLFDQNLALTAGEPGKQTEMLALNIYNTFYGRTGFEGVGQAKAVVFTLIVAAIALLQLKLTRSREVQQ